MKRLILIACLLFSLSAKADDNKYINPYSVKLFQISEQLPQLRNYRQSFQRLTGFEHSGLHWNRFIAVYINDNSQAYINNYFQNLRQFQYEFDEDFTDDMKNINQEIPRGFKPYPAGTVLIKENYSGETGRPSKPVDLTIMIKHQAGYDPMNGDWEYILNSVGGEILLRGKGQDPAIQEACANCHQNISERDYIFSTFYSVPGH